MPLRRETVPQLQVAGGRIEDGAERFDGVLLEGVEERVRLQEVALGEDAKVRLLCLRVVAADEHIGRPTLELRLVKEGIADYGGAAALFPTKYIRGEVAKLFAETASRLCGVFAQVDAAQLPHRKSFACAPRARPRSG